MKSFKSIIAVLLISLAGLFISFCSTTIKTVNAEKVVWLIEPQFDFAWNFHEGLAAVSKDKKIGYIDREGRVVIPPQFERGLSFSNGRARVQNEKDGKWGYIDKKGKLVIQLQFDNATEFSEGLAAVKKDRKWGYIDTDGKIVLPFQYESGFGVSDGLICFMVNELDGYMDRNGSIVIKPHFRYTSFFSEGYAVKKLRISKGMTFEDVYFFINKEGRKLATPGLEDVQSFSEGLAAVKTDGKWGYIDSNGKLVIKPRFDNCGSFHNGLAWVHKKGIFSYTYGYIDKKGNIVIEGPYNCSDFSEGFATYTVSEKGNSRIGYMNMKGMCVIEPQFEYANEFSEGFASVEMGGKWGYIRRPQTAGN